MIAFAVPGRIDRPGRPRRRRSLVERVEAVIPNPVLGDTPVEITYADYKDFGGVKFPTRIRQSAGGFPTLDLTRDRREAQRRRRHPGARRRPPGRAGVYARVATQMVADGVWYLTGGSHHSVVIEMKDHLIVVEGPLNDERALAVIAEARTPGARASRSATSWPATTTSITRAACAPSPARA